MSAVSAADYYVNGSASVGGTGTIDNPFQDISTGITAANIDGDKVIIAPGIYSGTANKGITIDRDITIQGAGANQTIIDCQGSGRAFIIIGFKNVTISGLTIQNGNSSLHGGAIENTGSVLTVTGCSFKDNAASNYGGAIFNTMGSLNINGCSFTGNVAERGGAIFTAGFDTITNCIFNGNKAVRGGAIENWAVLNVTGCNFYNNIAEEFGAAIYGYYIENNANDIISKTIVKYSRFVNNTNSTGLQDLYLVNLGYMPVGYVPSTMDATLNWWGDNDGPTSTRVSYEGYIPIAYDPWLMLNIYSNPSTIYTGQTSTITANVYKDSNNIDHGANAGLFFSGPQLTFTTDLGNVGSNSITVPWTFGMATATLRGDEGPGLATLTAADIQTVSTTVNILQPTTEDPQNPTVNAASETINTVGMQETGIPIVGLILAVLILFGGLITSKR